MIDNIKADKFGVTIEGHIELDNDLLAGEIYKKIFEEITNIELLTILTGGENIEYPNSET